MAVMAAPPIVATTNGPKPRTRNRKIMYWPVEIVWMCIWAHRLSNLVCSCTSNHLPLQILPFCRHPLHTSFPNDDFAGATWCNDEFGMEAAEPTAPMPTGMLFLALPGRHRQLSSSTLPYAFLGMTLPTTTSQCPLMCCDLNGWRQPPWCPTLSAATPTSHPAC